MSPDFTSTPQAKGMLTLRYVQCMHDKMAGGRWYTDRRPFASSCRLCGPHDKCDETQKPPKETKLPWCYKCLQNLSSLSQQLKFCVSEWMINMLDFRFLVSAVRADSMACPSHGRPAPRGRGGVALYTDFRHSLCV